MTTWVNLEDVNEVARRLEITPAATTTCDFPTAMRSYEPPEYASYWNDLESRPFMPTAEELEQYLIIMGRITGRFYDREWFASPGLLCALP
ncbi:hypothetical protein [Nonomuraea jabiensis]|uniref:Uncharacterized protein n=1 Tax=Nonomuraea jabiensis TaxID=882448 RepID=A0A7W9FXU1_9ACTN|nr:hypothetical protein [Nonomuraea jabiensis]MBB5773542.1 hypothetical protein [Nonomuraea jabiensis]